MLKFWNQGTKTKEANMPKSTDSHIEEVLRGLGVENTELTEMKQMILAMRRELDTSIAELDQKKLPRQLAIINSPQAVQMIDMLTDQIAVQQGLLKDAMKKHEIHDRLAVIKANIESLIVERDVQVRTINNITQQLKRISLLLATEAEKKENK